jgi:hypothetical protein
MTPGLSLEFTKYHSEKEVDNEFRPSRSSIRQNKSEYKTSLRPSGWAGHGEGVKRVTGINDTFHNPVLQVYVP